MPELPVPPHFDRHRVGEVWRVPYEEPGGRREALGRRARLSRRPRGRLPHLPRPRRRPEHVLHPGLRAVRRRAIRNRRRRRQPPPVRVPLPQPRRDHADRPDDGHAPRDADLPPDLAGRRGGRAPAPVHAGHRRRRGAAAAGASTRPSAETARHRRRVRAARSSSTTRARSRRAASTRSRSGRTTRCSAASATPSSPPSRRRCSSTRSRALRAAGLPGQGREPADRALFDPRARGDERPRRRADRRRATQALIEQPARLRRGDRRGPGEEPLRRLDDRRPARRRRRRERALAPKVYLLEDCTSPVVVPGVVDYTDEADAAFRRFAEAGMHVVRSTDADRSPGPVCGEVLQVTSSSRSFGR